MYNKHACKLRRYQKVRDLMQITQTNGRFPSRLWQDCLDVWTNCQVKLPKVIRWSKYLEHFKELRTQDCLQHSYSIGVVADMVMIMLEPHIKLDKHLLSTAFHVHDIGEGELRRDKLLAEKRERHDLQEYWAFFERYKNLPKPVFDHFRRAFLLQFCLKYPQSFPEEAKRIMSELAETKRMEALAFHAIECWDYMLYGIEQYQMTGNGYILHITIHANVELFDDLRRQLPGFEELFWQEDIRSWCLDFLAKHEPCPCGGYISKPS